MVTPEEREFWAREDALQAKRDAHYIQAAKEEAIWWQEFEAGLTEGRKEVLIEQIRFYQRLLQHRPTSEDKLNELSVEELRGVQQLLEQQLVERIRLLEA